MALTPCIITSGITCDPCPIPQEGRVSAIAFVQKGIPIADPTLIQTWKDIICNDFGVIFPEVRGSYNGGEAVEGPGYGRVQNRRQSANHSITYNQLYDCDLVDFYNKLNKSLEYVAFYTNGTKLWTSGNATMVNAKAPITDDPATTLEFEVMVSWTNIDMSICYDAPPIFQSCSLLQHYLTCLVDCNPIDIPCT